MTAHGPLRADLNIILTVGRRWAIQKIAALRRDRQNTARVAGELC
jgi:hypothetical protein